MHVPSDRALSVRVACRTFHVLLQGKRLKRLRVGSYRPSVLARPEFGQAAWGASSTALELLSTIIRPTLLPATSSCQPSR
eukprot:7299662-Pyramimonas_sp.AAC.1